MLEVRNLEVAYDGSPVVHGVDLDAREGELVAMLGANGAGKTSLLRAVSRLVQTKGTLRFDDVDITRLAPYKVARLGLIHVPEGRHVFPELTVAENLKMGEVARAGRPAAFSEAEIFDLFPALAALRNRNGWMLSGGEQQMVVIGRGLMAAPRLLLLDEPSLGLAPRVVKTVFDALMELRNRITMVIVEQNTQLVLGFCTRACVLAAGKIVLEGTADEIGSREQLLASYLGQTDAITHESESPPPG